MSLTKRWLMSQIDYDDQEAIDREIEISLMEQQMESEVEDEYSA